MLKLLKLVLGFLALGGFVAVGTSAGVSAPAMVAGDNPAGGTGSG
jgi:hypothetical protein